MKVNTAPVSLEDDVAETGVRLLIACCLRSVGHYSDAESICKQVLSKNENLDHEALSEFALMELLSVYEDSFRIDEANVIRAYVRSKLLAV